MSEQWKIMGDCATCRREPYCKKECTARRRTREKLIREVYQKYLESLIAKKKEEGAANEEGQGDHRDDEQGKLQPAAERSEVEG